MVGKMVQEGMGVGLSCKVLEVSRSGYYSHRTRPEPEREKANVILLHEIRLIHERSRKTYGSPRIQNALKEKGKNCSRKRVARIMKENNIISLTKKKIRITTTDSNHNMPIAERIFQTENQETMPVKPNEVWGTDITYVATKEGWLFLAIFLDIFTRKVVGFSMQDNMRVNLILEALEMALGRQGDITNLMSHSDRGSQYASEAYKDRLQAHGIMASMSRKGNCYDNAYVESFFHSLKTELIYHREFETREEAKKAIFEFIEVWYNRERLHSSLGYKTPEEFERLAQAS